MSTYLFQEARVGDEVNFNGHKLVIALDEEDNKCKDCFFNNLTKVSHLPFYRLSRIIKHCNILIDNLLTFRK